jgi:molybdopterin-guanine dinucleotide biosynthesis protein A
VADRGLTGLLLVGGRSRRFGSPKALARLGEETFAERAWRLLGETCDERFAVGRAEGLPFEPIADAVEGGGPLAGIVAGMRRARNDVVVAVPVDTPLLTPVALRELADACRDAAIPPGSPLPCAVATRALPVFEDALARGDLALRAVFERLDTAEVRLDPHVLANVNEPADLERLLGGR